jgi:hypothetical protein
MDSRRLSGCKFKKVRAKVLDELLWKEFIKLVENPKELEKQILKEEFIIDKDRADLEAMKDQATANLEDYKEKIKRFNWLVFEGEMSKGQYLEFKQDIRIKRQKEEERLEKANAALRRPRAIKNAVKRATKILAEQMKVYRTMEQVTRMMETAKELEELKNFPEKMRHNIKFQLWALDAADAIYKEIMKIIEALKTEVTISPEDFRNKDIPQFLYQQSRIIFQQYLDPERGIEVWNKGRFEIHLSIPKMAKDELNSKQIKSLRRPSRPALPPAPV